MCIRDRILAIHRGTKEFWRQRFGEFAGSGVVVSITCCQSAISELRRHFPCLGDRLGGWDVTGNGGRRITKALDHLAKRRPLREVRIP